MSLDTYLCNGYHDLMQKAMSFNDNAIVDVAIAQMLTEFAFGISAMMMQLS